MRHIPDEELHAYLDQALSRSQCVEIECHLADCPRCRALRDDLASLRDRTTALLGLVSPQRVTVPPPFSALRARPLARSRWKIYGTYAAALTAAVLAGFAGHSILDDKAMTDAKRSVSADPPIESLVFAPEPVPTASPIRTQSLQAASPAGASPARLADDRSIALPGRGDAPPLDIRSIGSELEIELDFGGLWETVPWEEAAALTENLVPRIAGLPVVEVRVQQRSATERPLVVVTQQDPNGNLVRTIEGPVGAVALLVTQQISRHGPSWGTSEPTRTRPEYLPAEDGSPRRSIRVATVMGRLAVDSLNLLRERLTLR